jgi:hypothetical protein
MDIVNIVSTVVWNRKTRKSKWYRTIGELRFKNLNNYRKNMHMVYSKNKNPDDIYITLVYTTNPDPKEMSDFYDSKAK